MISAVVEDRRMLTDAVRAAASGVSPRPFISRERGFKGERDAHHYFRTE